MQKRSASYRVIARLTLGEINAAGNILAIARLDRQDANQQQHNPETKRTRMIPPRCFNRMVAIVIMATAILAQNPESHAAASKVAWLQGSALEDGSITITTATPMAVQWNEASSIDPTVFEHALSTPTKLVVKQDGDYLVAVTTPFISISDADLRPTQATEIYVNGAVVPGTRSQSSYIRNQPRNANMQRESSNHVQALLKGLKANDVIEVKIHKIAQASTATSLQSGSLYAELIDSNRTVFAGLSSGPASGSNLNADVLAGETPAQLAWTSVRKDNGITHSDGAANISLTAGTYLVFVNIPLATTVQRASTGLEVTLGGAVVPGGRARQGYIRRTGGHNLASVHWAGLVQVTGTQNLTLQTLQLAQPGEVTLQNGKQASVYIEKLSDSAGLLFSSALLVDNPNAPDNWNPANKAAIVWGPNSIIDNAIYTHSPDTTQIQVKQAGNYLLVYNDQLQSTGARVNPRITVEVNGEAVRGAETKTHYIRNAGGHNHSSACLVFLLENLAANDTITVSTQREGNTQAVASDEFASEAAILGLIKKDNLVLPPGDTTPPRVTFFAGDVFGFEIRIPDLGRETDTTSVAVTVNGTPVTPTVNKVRGVTTIRHSYTDFPPTGSTQTIGVSFKDTGTPPGSHQVTLDYTVTDQFTEIPPEFAASNVDTTQSGFVAHVTQISEAQHETGANNVHGNRIAAAEQQLRGEAADSAGNRYLNEAGPQTASSWVIVPENVEVINFEQTGADAGNFNPTPTIPRIPGWGGTDNGIVAEFLTFLELKKGFVVLGVNSDDGFKASIGASNKDLLARTVGFLDGGRGAADSLFNIVVKEDGIYPFRLLWFEGGGGASVELFSVHNGEKVLVNDRSNPNAIKAYRVGPARPYITKVEPVSGQITQQVVFEIADDGLSVVPGSVTLTLDGKPVTAAVTQNNGITTVIHDAGTFLAGGDHTVVLTFDESSTPPTKRTVNHTFNIPQGQTTVLLDRPVAYWRFGETTGQQAFSEVGTGLTARYFGDPTLGAERVAVGDPTSAVLLDNSKSQWIDIPDHADINTVSGPWQFKSIELWFKARNLPTSNPQLPGLRISERQVLYEQGGATRGMNIYLSGTQAQNPTQAELWFNILNRAQEAWGGTLPFDDQGFSPNGEPLAVKATIEANKPYHIVLVMEGDNSGPDSFNGKLIGYINGEKFGEATGVHLLYNHTDDVGVGARNEEVAFHDYIINGAGTFAPEISTAGERFFFDGWIDELALYNTALSAERVKAHFEAGRTEVPSGGQPPTGTLHIESVRLEGNSIRIQWQGSARLQQATSVTGPYADVAGASSPFVAPVVDGEARFYRLTQ